MMGFGMDEVTQSLMGHLIEIYFIVGSVALFFFILRTDKWLQKRARQRVLDSIVYEDNLNTEENNEDSLHTFEESIESLKQEIKEQTQETIPDREEDKKS